MEKKTPSKSAPQQRKAPEKSSPGKKDFLLVGLGASAGGVKALQEFFATMPPNSGMAFVVILHLSPAHESKLAEIIRTHTQMPVTLVTETHRVEPDNVYVIPPNAQLELVDGVVRCEQLTGERGERVAIDIFFRTLASAYEKNAVCVVLSGTGTDGTLGLKAVKEADGFAIVQTPEDAEYDSMPRSAIATHLVDWVLPVRQMPERLIQLRDSSERLYLTSDDGDGKIAGKIQADESLREILTALRVRTGHDFSNYKTPTLVRRIARHLQIHDLPDIPAYLDFLRENPDEIHSLVKNLLINVTNFFRDKDAWAVLEREVVPNLFGGKTAQETVRVWSCGCASGEEAYSLAMLLSEYAHTLNDPPKIQVFATDVDEDAIAEAREHRYPQSIEADVTPERLSRFFIKEGKYYRVRKELRETVLFAPHNVLRDPPFSRLDLIVCRNLLIYLNRETQERVMEIFHYALGIRGYLFLGSSESADSAAKIFAPVDKKQRIYTRRPGNLPHNFAPPQMPLAGRWEVRLPSVSGRRRERSSLLDELNYKLLESIAPPSVLVDQDFDIQYLSEGAGRFLRFKGGEPSNNLLKLVNADLLPDLRAALFSARHERKAAHFRNIRVRLGDEETRVTLIVRPVETDGATSDFLLVIFDENNKLLLPEKAEEEKPARQFSKDEASEAVVERLEDELKRMKETLRATIEQHEVAIEELKASNEELQAINEELRSTSEELETSKEELQSVNEELTTVNHEHKEKIDETIRAYSDLQNLMASTNIATIFLDRRFRIQRLTPPVEKIFNISPADIGRPLEHFTHKLRYEDLAQDAAEVLRSLAPVEREIRDASGSTYLTRILPYRTLDDRIEGVVLNFLDITARKRAESALNQSEERLRTILESAKDYAIFTLDLDRRVTLWNAGAETVFGYAEKEIIGESGDILFVPEDRKRGAPGREAENALNKGRAANERWHLRRDKSRFFGSGLTMPLRDGDGNITGYVKIMRDLTEQKKLEDAKFFLAAIVESSEDSVVTVNFKGEITSWNKAAEKLYGYAAKEVIGNLVTMLALPEDIKQIFGYIDDIKHSRKVKIYD
ncbi:MAG TPA: chemotaxis protein CheB, partial [Pyrinomonadaceae bacterium]|nr:chemotaxis protein CheB [Pyrinomonadaceae bacterium]